MTRYGWFPSGKRWVDEGWTERKNAGGSLEWCWMSAGLVLCKLCNGCGLTEVCRNISQCAGDSFRGQKRKHVQLDPVYESTLVYVTYPEGSPSRS